MAKNETVSSPVTISDILKLVQGATYPQARYALKIDSIKPILWVGPVALYSPEDARKIVEILKKNMTKRTNRIRP